MEVIPAIDLLGGKVARLRRGERSSASFYSDDSLAVAKEFVAQGAEWLHVVDLDAAFGKGNNLAAIAELASVSGAKLQVGGGIRSVKQAQALLEKGVQRVIVGTAALEERALAELAFRFGKRVWVACDLRKGKLEVKGWTEKTGLFAKGFLARAERTGVGGAVVTDITRDGVVAGISKKFFSQVRKQTRLELIAAGGVSYAADIRWLAKAGFEGAIVGKALYEKKISLREALEAGGENAG